MTVASAKSKIGHTHDYETYYVEATCTEQGYTVFVCSCGDTYTLWDYNNLPQGHMEETVTGIPATCTTDGITDAIICSVCNAVILEQTEIPAFGHNYSSFVYTPTCTQQGYTIQICENCDDNIIYDYIDAVGHLEEIIPGIPADCINDGLSEGVKCSVCNAAIIEQTVLPALGHDYISVIVPPTCVNRGYTVHICSYCDDSYVTDSTDVAEHTYGDWIIVVEATNTVTGLKYRLCVDCGNIEYEAINIIEDNETEMSDVTIGFEQSTDASIIDEPTDEETSVFVEESTTLIINETTTLICLDINADTQLGIQESQNKIETEVEIHGFTESESISKKLCEQCSSEVLSIKEVNSQENKVDYKLGDVNSDGKITALDARLALRCSALLEVFTAIQKLCADVDFSGKITSADARKILRYCANLDDFGLKDTSCTETSTQINIPVEETTIKMVYITPSGTKYHTDSCSALRSSSSEIKLGTAIELGYEACKICKP